MKIGNERITLRINYPAHMFTLILLLGEKEKNSETLTFRYF